MSDSKKCGLFYRPEGHLFVDIPCKVCGTNVPVKKYKESYALKHGGSLCAKCRSDLSSKTMKRTHANTDPVTKSKRARINGALADKAQSVKKQWQTIRSNPDMYRENCHARSERMKKVWKDWSDEQKNYIISRLVASQGKSRSAVSNRLKALMEQEGLTGFESEKVISGFIADEVNEQHKIIVEFYGDLYHCNPRKYKDESVFINAIQRTVGEQWLRDRRRLGCFYKNGYSVVVIWEYDFMHHPDQEVKRIKNEIDRKTNLGRVA